MEVQEVKRNSVGDKEGPPQVVVRHSYHAPHG